MEKTLRNISQVSFIFFCIFGALHIGASMLVMQGVETGLVRMLYQSMDLPFLLAGLSYGSIQLSTHIAHITGKFELPLKICGGISAVLFLIALYINFFLTDVQF